MLVRNHERHGSRSFFSNSTRSRHTHPVGFRCFLHQDQQMLPPPASIQAIGTATTPSCCPAGDGRSVRGRRGVGGSRSSHLASGQAGGRSTRRGRGRGGGVLGVRRDGALPAVQRGRLRVQAAAGGGGQQGPEGGQEHGHQIHFRAADQVDLLQPLLLHSLLHYLRRLRRNHQAH